MKLYPTDTAAKAIKGKYVFLDNDFLSMLSRDIDSLTEFFDLLQFSYIFIDPLTEFEYLNGSDLENRQRKKFVITNPIFLPVLKHQSIFLKLEQNAAVLAEVYSYLKPAIAPKYVDLMLASRLMFDYYRTLLITGNKKHFPSNIFDVEGIINYEQQNNGMRAYSIIKFNRDKFVDCHQELQGKKAVIEQRSNAMQPIDDLDIPF